MARTPRPAAQPDGTRPPAARRRSHGGRITAAAIGVAGVAALGVGLNHTSRPSASKVCAIASVDAMQSQPLLTSWTAPGTNACKPMQTKAGLTLPDPRCTPGAVNPTLTITVLKNKDFSTGPCVRDKDTSADAKNVTYSWYGIPRPPGNVGQKQVCEKDHLISLELGGADSLANIWPQCGPDQNALNDRYFKRKDLVENYLAAQVRSGAIDLASAQHGIASDWTQYIDKAAEWYKSGAAVTDNDEG